MLFSIIVPVYNRKKTICRCIESILRQKFQDYELIIIDDGSDDGTDRICNLYDQNYDNVKVWHQKNAGVSAARNIGIYRAEGRYIIFVDSDDWIPDDYLVNIEKACNKYGEDSLLCTSMKVNSKRGVQLYCYKNSEYSFADLRNFGVLVDKGLINSPVNKVYCRKILIDNKIEFPQKLSLGEDLVFNLKYIDSFTKINFMFINHTYYNVDITGEDSLDRKWREDYFEIQVVLLKLTLKYLSKWKENGKLNCIRQDGYRRMRNGLYRNCIVGSINYYLSFIGEKSRRKIIKKIKNIRKSKEYLECIHINKEKTLMLEIIRCWYIGKMRRRNV